MVPPSPMTATPYMSVADAVLKVQMLILDGKVSSESQLLAAGTLLSRPDYEDAVVERTISKLCGYPLCRNPRPEYPPKSGRRYRIALREHRVYDLRESYKYCSDACAVASQAFSDGLEEERVDVTARKVQRVLVSFGLGNCDGEEKEVLGKDGALGFSRLAICEKVDAGSGEISIDEWMGHPSAIEGYIPQSDRLRIGVGDCQHEKTGFESRIYAGDEHGMDPEASTQNEYISHVIAKRLENVVLDEKIIGKRMGSQLSKAFSGKKVSESNEADFHSSVFVKGQAPAKTSFPSERYLSEHSLMASQEILGSEFDVYNSRIVGEQSNVAPANPPFTSVQNLAEDSDGTLKNNSDISALKSSLKTSGSKVGNRTVTWADNTLKELMGRNKDDDISMESSQNLRDYKIDHSLRLPSVEACAAALSKAEAVDAAGVLVLPQPQNDNKEQGVVEMDQGYSKWPKKDVLTDITDIEDSWHDTPPEGFVMSLSSFGMMLEALLGWVTRKSISYIYGHGKSSRENSMLFNATDYPLKCVLLDGSSSEIRRTLELCISRIMPGIVMDLKIPLPVSTLEVVVGQLLDTMSFIDAIPPFRTEHWRLVVVLFLDALSVLNPACFDIDKYRVLRDFLLPFESGNGLMGSEHVMA